MKIFPEYQQFEATHAIGKAQLVWAVLPADLETPVQVALKLQNKKSL